MKGVTPDGHSLYNLANISYTGILSVNLGVHIGVISPDIQYNSVTLDQISLNSCLFLVQGPEFGQSINDPGHNWRNLAIVKSCYLIDIIILVY